MTHSEYVEKTGEIINGFIHLVTLRYESRENELEREVAELRRQVAELSAARAIAGELPSFRRYGCASTAARV